MLANYAHQAPKLTGNSIGILNVQKRDRRDVYSDVAALPPRRRAVRNGARVISGSAISTGSRRWATAVYFLVPLEKQRMFSPVLGILEAERGRSL